MIYDHIKNIGLYKGLSPALDTALDFIATAEWPMDEGTILLPHGVKAIVSHYITRGLGIPSPEFYKEFGSLSIDRKDLSPRRYETHLRYADVHFTLCGFEDILCCPTELLTPATDYDASTDCQFYDDPSIIKNGGKANDLYTFRPCIHDEYFAVVFPGEAHISELIAGVPTAVNKVVLKVPME